MREFFFRYVGPVIDEVLGLRCTSYGYQYSEIAGSLSSVYFCGGCVRYQSLDIPKYLRESFLIQTRARVNFEKFATTLPQTI